MPTIPKARALADGVTTADIINAIRSGAPQSYQDAVPVVSPNDLNSLNKVGAALYNYQPHMNYFVQELWNRLAIMRGQSKIYDNVLRMFKIGLLNFGETIGDYFVDVVNAHNYDMATAEKEFMKIEPSNVLTAYYNMNFQKFYKCTITRENIKLAFLSWDGVNDLVDRMVQALYTSCNWHEYLIMKHMIGVAILNGGMKAIQTPVLSLTTAKQVTAAIRQASNDMETPSRDRNLARVLNFTDKPRQVLVINTASEALIDVEVLAASYNLPYSEFLSGHRVTLTAFNEFEEGELAKVMEDDAYNPDFKTFTADEITALNSVPACLISREWFVVADHLFEMHQSPYNSDGLYYNDTLHKWTTFATSPFEEAVVFVSGTPGVTSVTVAPATLSMPAGSQTTLTATVVTTNFAPKGVTWSVEPDAAATGTVAVDYAGTVKIGVDASGKFTVTATSKFDGTKTGSCVITVA